MKALMFFAETVISSGIVWAATMGFKAVMKNRLSPSAHLWIWLVFALRLLIPITIDSPVRLFSVPNAGEIHESVFSFLSEDLAAEPILFSPARAGTEAMPVQDAQDNVSTRGTGESARDLEALTAGIWCAGAVFVGAWTFRSYRNARKTAVLHSMPAPSWLKDQWENICTEARLHREPHLRVCGMQRGPELLFPNWVLLPVWLAKENSSRVRMALLHEAVHYRRGDQYILLLGALAQTVYWFNPFIWLAMRTIRLDLEAACDSQVADLLGPEGQSAYASTLLSLAAGEGPEKPILGLVDGRTKKHMERRIRSIFGKRTSKASVRTCAFFFAALLGVISFTNACAPLPKGSDSAQATALMNRDRESIAEYLPCSYSSEAQWDAAYFPVPNLTIEADTTLSIPDVPSYPVVRLTGRMLTEQEAQKLVHAFVPPGCALYQSPWELTKEEWEQNIAVLQDSLAAIKEGGTLDDIWARDEGEIEDEIDWAQSQMESASEEVSPLPASSEFTPVQCVTSIDDSGPLVPGLCSWFESEGKLGLILANETGDAGQGGAFRYSMTIGWETEPNVNESVAFLEERQNRIDPEDSFLLRRHLEEAQEWYAKKEKMDSFDVDLNDAAMKAAQLLQSLDISDVQITACDKAAFQFRNIDNLYGTGEEICFGSLVEFVRENGGVPCVESNFHDMINNESQGETGWMLLDTDGTPVEFSWNNMSEVEEVISAKTDVIPFEEACESAVDQLAAWEATAGNTIDEVEYVAQTAAVVMTYVDQADNAERTVVPAYSFSFEGTCQNRDTKETMDYNNPTLLISALDGSLIGRSYS